MARTLKRPTPNKTDLADLRRRERARLRLSTPDNGDDDIDYDLLERMIEAALAAPPTGDD